jgi:hypothetical protein
MKRIKEANADDSALEDKYYRYVFSEETLDTVFYSSDSSPHNLG